MQINCNQSRRKKESGFTLLEVMLATVLLSIGLLALADAGSISLSSSRTAHSVSLATASSEEIFELMRRNRDNIASYNGFDTTNNATRPVAAGTLQNDYDEWKSEVDRVIPGGCGTLAVTQNTPLPTLSSATATITWPPCGAPGSRSVAMRTIF